jgi:hypothetical protein
MAPIFCDGLSLSRLPYIFTSFLRSVSSVRINFFWRHVRHEFFQEKNISRKIVDLQKMRTGYRYLLRCFERFLPFVTLKFQKCYSSLLQKMKHFFLMSGGCEKSEFFQTKLKCKLNLGKKCTRITTKPILRDCQR